MLHISKVTLTLHFTTPAVFPYWMGSAFRGGFGQNLRRAICTDLSRDCYTCETKENCLFYYTHMKKKAERGHAPPVKSIVLIPPFFGKSLEIEENATLDVDVLFCGDFARYLPHVILGMNLFGQRGLYTQRYHGLNRFEVKSITCCFSHKKIYDGETIFLKNLKTMDIKDITYETPETITIGFKTPFTGREFPPDFGTLLTLIRNRVIRFVNEYGNKEKVLPVTASGTIEKYTEHYHKLERRSSRSRKKVFHSYTGVVTYDIDELDDIGAWMLNLGFVVGCSPDCSFGCGFLQRMYM